PRQHADWRGELLALLALHDTEPDQPGQRLPHTRCRVGDRRRGRLSRRASPRVRRGLPGGTARWRVDGLGGLGRFRRGGGRRLGGGIGGDFGRFLQYGLFSFVKPHDPRRAREAISVRDVLVPCSNEFIARINGATTPEELFAILVSGGSGYTGGTTRLAIRTW